MVEPSWIVVEGHAYRDGIEACTLEDGQCAWRERHMRVGGCSCVQIAASLQRLWINLKIQRIEKKSTCWNGRALCVGCCGLSMRSDP